MVKLQTLKKKDKPKKDSFVKWEGLKKGTWESDQEKLHMYEKVIINSCACTVGINANRGKIIPLVEEETLFKSEG